MGKNMKVCLSGSSRDKGTLQWALELADVSFVEDPSEAEVHVVSEGAGDEPPWTTAPRTVVLASEDLLQSEKWLSVKGALWLVRSDAEATRVNCDDGVVGVSRIGWSCQEPVRVEPYHLERPTIALGQRVKEFAVPDEVAMSVEEDSPATVLLAPSDATSVLRAIHRGIPVVDFKDSPWRWAFLPGHNGFLLERGDSVVQEIFQKLDLIRRTTCPQPGEVEARRDRFLRDIHELVLGRKRKVVCFVKKENPIRVAGTRKRFDAVKEFGFDTRIGPIGHLAKRHDLVLLGGRVPVGRVREISRKTKKPIMVAIGDAICDEERLDWYKSVSRYASILFIIDPPEMLPPVKCKVVHLHQATQDIESEKFGFIIRHPQPPVRRSPSNPSVCFLANHWYPRRVRIVSELAKVAKIHLFGNGVPSLPGTEAGPRQGAKQSMALMRNAKVTLSTSIANDREMTSVRLFDACAVGAHVLAEWFPGCENIYPEGLVHWFKSPQHGAEVLAEMLKKPFREEREMRWRVMEYTWRRYSYHDRVRSMLKVAQDHLGLDLLPLGE